MKLKDADVKDLTDLFEEALSRAQRVNKQQRIQFRKKIRNELFSLMAWELATPAGIISRWEERLSDVLAVLPFSFKDEIARVLVDKLHAPTLIKTKKGGQFAWQGTRAGGFAFKIAHYAYVLEVDAIVLQGTGAELIADARVRAAYLGG